MFKSTFKHTPVTHGSHIRWHNWTESCKIGHIKIQRIWVFNFSESQSLAFFSALLSSYFRQSQVSIRTSLNSEKSPFTVLWTPECWLGKEKTARTPLWEVIYMKNELIQTQRLMGKESWKEHGTSRCSQTFIEYL